MMTVSSASRLSVLLALLCALSTTAPAQAHNHAPPTANIVKGTRTQQGKLGSYCWWRRLDNGDYGQTCLRKSGFLYPREALRARRSVTLTFGTEYQPADLELMWWRRMPQSGVSERPPRRLAYETSIAPSGVVNVRIPLPAREGKMFLLVAGTWWDQEGIGLEEQGSWHFHLKVFP